MWRLPSPRYGHTNSQQLNEAQQAAQMRAAVELNQVLSRADVEGSKHRRGFAGGAARRSARGGSARGGSAAGSGSGSGSAVAHSPAELEEEDDGFDFSQFPLRLDAAISKLDEDAALRPTILNVDAVWAKDYKRGLLSPPQVPRTLTYSLPRWASTNRRRKSSAPGICSMR